MDQFSFSPSGKPVAIAISPDSTLISAITNDGSVHVWDIQTARQIHSLNLDVRTVRNCALAFSPSGKFLAASCDYSICIWKLGLGKPISMHTFSSDSLLISRIAFNSSETQVAVSNCDDVDFVGAAACFSLNDEEVSEVNVPGYIQSLRWDGKLFVVDVYQTTDCSGKGRAFKTIGIEPNDTLFEFDMTTCEASGYPIRSPDGRLMSVGSGGFGSNVDVYGTNTEGICYTIVPASPTHPVVAFSADSTLIACGGLHVMGGGSGENPVEVRKAEDGMLLKVLQVPGFMHQLQFSPSSKVLAAWSFSGPGNNFYDMNTFNLVGEAEIAGKLTAMSKDSRYFARAGDELTVLRLP